MSGRGNDTLNLRIVGVVKDAKYSTVKDTVPPVFFIPWRQAGSIGNGIGRLTFYVRSAVPPEEQLRAIPALLERLAPGVPVEGLKTLPQQIRDNVYLDRLISILSAVFASLATLLAAIGLYGVLAYTVQQRTREIGVRIALGADAARVRGLVFRQTSVMMAAGALLGVAGALAAGRGLQSLLYQLKGYDPALFGLALIVLLGVAAAASWVPVVRASRVDPVEALRQR